MHIWLTAGLPARIQVKIEPQPSMTFAGSQGEPLILIIRGDDIVEILQKPEKGPAMAKQYILALNKDEKAEFTWTVWVRLLGSL